MHKGMVHYLFAYNKGGKLDVQQVMKILKPDFAPQGHQHRVVEEIVMAKFIDFLKSIEGKPPESRLEMQYLLLCFCSVTGKVELQAATTTTDNCHEK